MHSSRMHTTCLLTISQHAQLGVYLPEGVPTQGCVPAGGGTCPGTPPVNRMTDRCKNITLPQISFMGGNK